MDWQQLLDEAAELRNNGQTKEAVKAYQRIAGEALKHQQKEIAAEASHMIGVTYYMADDFDQAEDYLLESKEQFERINDKRGLGAVNRDLGMNSTKRGDLEKGKDYLNWSIYFLNAVGDKGHLGITQVKLGLNYVQSNELDRAEKLILEGIASVEQSPEKFFLSTAYFDLARVQLKAEKKQEAKQSAQKALEILDSISNKEQYFMRRKEIEEFLESAV